MAVVGVECCGEVMSVEEALRHVETRRNSCEWTYELLSAMLEGHVAHPSHDDPTRISTTTLTSKCLRQQALSRFGDYIVKPSDLWASFRGTMFHRQLEAWAHPRSYGEARFYIADIGEKIPAIKKALPRKDRSFSGSPDLVDPVVGILYDYKRTKEVPRFNTVWGDHIEQLNVNRWLIDHADTVEVKLDPLGAETVTHDLSDEDFRDLYVPVEWQELVIVYVDDKGPKPITVTESIDVPTKSGGTKKARVPGVWDDERVERYIAERYIAARTALAAKSAPVPAGWEHQSHVLCGYCPVRDKCAQLESTGK